MAMIELAAVDLPGGEALADWRTGAACVGVDPRLFFPEQWEPMAPAKRICAGCPVAEESLEQGMAEKHGIWGGLGELGRRAVRRRRRALVVSAGAALRPVDDAVEVRQAAVELVNEMRDAGNGRHAVAEVAEALEISETDLRAWVKADELGRGFGLTRLFADRVAPDLDPSWFREKSVSCR